MKPTTFEKAIERDSTFVTQQFFARNLTHDLATDYGIDSPHRPIVIHYADKENIRLFENKEAMHWIQDRLLEKNLESAEFMTKILDRHKEILPRLEGIWSKGKLDQDGFEEYRALVREATLNITIYYYSGVDERTPKPIQDMVVETRKTDEFGARNDEFIRSCVRAHGLNGELARVLQVSELVAPQEEVLADRLKGCWLIDGEVVEQRYDQFLAAHPEYAFTGVSSASDAALSDRSDRSKRIRSGEGEDRKESPAGE